ncbi:hypothetical protein, partial [Salmonella sp. s29873]|uniref:hypothetical protein n=1 Tax=Salmonella sp. s29873 TaxID=3159634 RepID=UPI003980A5E5
EFESGPVFVFCTWYALAGCETFSVIVWLLYVIAAAFFFMGRQQRDGNVLFFRPLLGNFARTWCQKM